MTDKLSGSCLCGKMVFELEDAFDEFHLCHCQQCQKASGSAHVAHLFTRADNINWLQGQEHLAQYDVPNRAISNAFCQSCGSPMPYVSLASGKLVVPAGALDKASSLAAQDHIFYDEKADWYEGSLGAPRFKLFPE